MTPAFAFAGQVGAALTAGAGRKPEPPERRTHAKVRRNSWAPGRGGQRVKLTWADKAALWWAYRKWERRQARAAKAKIRATGHVAAAVYELLLNEIVRGGRGQVETMSLERIARIVGHAKSAVVCALARLREHGWIDWVRRFRPTGEAGRRGPQVEQDINAYWPTWPADLGEGGPPPDDDAHRRKAAAAGRSDAADPDSPLGSGLEALAAAIAAREKRESSDRSDSGGMKSPDASACGRPHRSLG